MSKEKILIVEDEFIVANDLKLMLLKAGYAVCGIAATVNSARKMISQFQPSWVLLDIFLSDESMGTDLARELTEMNIGFIYISANTNQSVLEKAKATQPYGFLVKPFKQKDMLIMLDIAMQKHQENLLLLSQKGTLIERELSRIIERNAGMEPSLIALPEVFQGLIPFDLLKISIGGSTLSETEVYCFIRESFTSYKFLKNQEFYEELAISSPSKMKLTHKTSPIPTGIFTGMDFRRQLLDDGSEKQLTDVLQLNSKLTFFFKNTIGKTIFLTFYSKDDKVYYAGQLKLIQNVENHLVKLFQPNAIHANKQISLQEAAVTSKGTRKGFEGIIGGSNSLLKVMDNIDLVASASISVLVLGESGTGKEQVSKAIHKNSTRASKPFIVVNCAALPIELIESELFGHEKGAFTGATDRKVGKFEAANGGTIFLDEIGELPLEAQVKLLRVLQEHEFERVGSSKTIKTDVRVIAATNRNMEKEVADGRMRLDLYYRLNVFPIELPPLRDRIEDIPLLVNHFISKFSARMQRNVSDINPLALEQLLRYQWPGNIRELEHLIERSVLIAKGKIIERVDLPKLDSSMQAIQLEGHNDSSSAVKTLEQLEKDHITQVLKLSNGRINGPGGAAEILGLPPSTLNLKLKKYGLSKDFY